MKLSPSVFGAGSVLEALAGNFRVRNRHVMDNADVCAYTFLEGRCVAKLAKGDGDDCCGVVVRGSKNEIDGATSKRSRGGKGSEEGCADDGVVHDGNAPVGLG